MKKLELILQANEEKILPFVWINGDESSYDINAKLVGDGAKLHIIGVFLGTATRNVTFNTTVIHEGKNTFSRTTLRGVFKDRSAFSNDAMIHIVKGAKNADGYFASKILLFDDAKGRSVPSLEIDENELKAGHASTVGRPDANQIFYLRSRGICEKEAEELLITGFFEPAIKLLPSKIQKKVNISLNKSLKKPDVSYTNL